MSTATATLRPPTGPARLTPSEAQRDDFVARLVARLGVGSTADPVTVRAVTLLTDAADPARADAMRPHVGDAAPLVERLSVWALRRADDDTVEHALAVLDDVA